MLGVFNTALLQFVVSPPARVFAADSFAFVTQAVLVTVVLSPAVTRIGTMISGKVPPAATV